MKKSELQSVKKAAILLSQLREHQRNDFLKLLAGELEKNKKAILLANNKDVTKAEKKRLEKAFIQRLILDEDGLKKMTQRLKELQKLHSNIGEVIEENKENGLLLKKVRVPLGVIFIIYESRPEVTIDVAALCTKSGNACILKGGSESLETNKALYSCIVKALEKSGLPKDAVSFISSSDRNITKNILKEYEYIDLVIARGGYKLVKAVLSQSTIPVLAHSAGGARIFIDKSADLAMAEKIVINAKIDKPAACNSIDTVVVHQEVAQQFIPQLVKKLKALKVAVYADKPTTKLVDAPLQNSKNWGEETLGLSLSIKMVKNVAEAVEFINTYSKKHSEGIVATDAKTIDFFTSSIDVAALFVNCSTRLHDGYVFGLGAEMGIATGKLHARGPVGLKELTTYRWQVYGTGQIRE